MSYLSNFLKFGVSESSKKSDFDGSDELAPRRKHQIEILQRFLQSNSPLLLLIGNEGVGKKHLAQCLVTSVQTKLRIIQLQATKELEPFAMAAVLSQHWAIPRSETDEVYHHLLDEILIKLEEQQQHCLLIIDDAHTLSMASLMMIAHLSSLQTEAGETRLYILLLGEPQLLDQVGTLQTGNIPHLMVEALSRKEIIHFINYWQIKWYGDVTQAVPEEEIEKISQQSGGLPSVVKQLAKQWFLTNVTQTVTSQENNEKIIAENLPSSEMSAPPLNKESIIPEANFHENGEDILGLYEEDGTFWQKHKVKTIALLSLGAIALALFLNNQHAEKSNSPEFKIEQQVKENPSAKKSFLEAKSQDELLKKPTPSLDKKVKAENIKIESKSVPSIVNVTPPAEKLKIESQPVARPSKIVLSQQNQPEKISKKTRFVKKDAHDSYILQLIGSYDHKATLKFIEEKHLKNKVEIIVTQREGKNWYIVGYGRYKDRKTAMLSVKTLPEYLQHLHPWVREASSRAKRGI